jgi:dipeptidyl aminopeptidase/acylaminoacyl peptidase
VRVRSRFAALVFLALSLVLGLALFSPAVSSSDRDAGPGRFLVGAHDDTTTPFNLVSVPALIGHRYDGHALRLDHRLSRTGDAVRWAISYRGDGLRLTGTLSLPRSPGPHPVVVALHGYVPPNVYRRGSGLQREEARMAADGFVVLHPDYRNFAGSSRESGKPVVAPLGYPADVLNAVAALRRAHLPGVDLSRTSLFGRSMGGGVAMQVAVARPAWFDALVLYAPVSGEAADDYQRWVLGSPALRQRVEAAYGDPASRPAFWREASVTNYLDRLTMPVRIHHGTDDPMCPEAWSAHTADVMRADGVDVRLSVYPGEVHRFTDQWPLFMARVDRFLTSTTATPTRTPTT